MISKQEATADATHIHTLWQNLTSALVDIYDAHGVCAIVANEVAQFAGCTAVVGLSGGIDSVSIARIASARTSGSDA